jgi:hypothetical protein
MPDLPISGLPSLLSPEPTDVFAIVNNGITKKTTVQAVGNSVFTQISSSVILPSQTGSFTTTSSFNSFTQSINNATGSFGVTNYYGSFYHTASMLNTVPGTPNTMSLSTVDLSNGVIISGSIKDKIKFLHSGIYDIQFSAQLDKTSAGADFQTYIWIRQNDLDVPTSNTAVTVLGGSNAKTVASWNWFVSASANDFVQLMWASDASDARIQYDPAPPYGPAVPSLIVTADRIG